MANPFSKLEQVTRYLGDNILGQPYLSGTFFIKFELPTRLSDYLPEGIDLNQAANTLAATCLSVTPPGGTFSKVTMDGLRGLKWSVVSRFDYGDEITAKFIELRQTRINKIFHAWCRMMGNMHIGIAFDKNTRAGGVVLPDYAGKIYYISTDPSASVIEFGFVGTGIFPLKDPLDSFDGDVTANDKREIDIPLNINRIYEYGDGFNEVDNELRKLLVTRPSVTTVTV